MVSSRSPRASSPSPRDLARREALVACCVLGGTTCMALAGVQGWMLILPSLLVPLVAFGAFGHLVGRRAGMACVVAGLSSAILAAGSAPSLGLVDALMPAFLGLGAFYMGERVERRIAAQAAYAAAMSNLWMSIEVDDEPISAPATAIALVKRRSNASDLHAQIARRRRNIAMARRA